MPYYTCTIKLLVLATTSNIFFIHSIGSLRAAATSAAIAVAVAAATATIAITIVIWPQYTFYYTALAVSESSNNISNQGCSLLVAMSAAPY